MEKMKAAVMYGPNDVRVEQVDKPVCAEDGIIVKVEAVGLCGSDIRNLTTDSRQGKYPVIYGHEQAGIIAEIGKMAKCDFEVGDRVYVSPVIPEPSATAATGSFAEYLPISAWSMDHVNILPLPEDVSFEKAVMAEPLSSVYSCQEAVNVKIGQTIAILGAGPIGCLHSELAKMRGAGKVIMVEITEERLKMSLNFGVDHAVNGAKVDPVEAVMDLTNGEGAFHVISANPTTKAQQQAIFICARGGIVTLFGGVPKGALTEIDTNRIHYFSLWLYGHFGFELEENEKAFELICTGQFDAEKYITRVMPLDEINEAIEQAKAGKAIKIVFNP